MALAAVAVIGFWQWDQISKLEPVARSLDDFKAKGLPKATQRHFAVIFAGNTFSSALQVYSLEAAPVRFGMVKHNLGLVAYARFKLTQDVAQLNEAVTLFNVALQTRTANRTRVGWAETQYMLGFVLVDLAIRNFEETTLDTADTAFRSAASVFDKKLYPQRANLLHDRIERLPALREFIRRARLCLEEGSGRSDGKACERILTKRSVK